MYYIAGWEDAEQCFESLFEVYHDYPEIFYTFTTANSEGDLDLLPSDQQPAPTERAMVDKVELVNSEGNYHLFIFRPAFQFEILEHIQRTVAAMTDEELKAKLAEVLQKRDELRGRI